MAGTLAFAVLADAGAHFDHFDVEPDAFQPTGEGVVELKRRFDQNGRTATLAAKLVREISALAVRNEP